MFSLQGKVAIITGGGSGIGLATAKRFVEAGATVVIGDINESSDIAEQIGATFIPTDVSIEKQVQELIETTYRKFGKIDILFNNAGIGSGGKVMAEEDSSVFEKAFSINTLGVMFGIKHSAKYLQHGGVIINSASVAGLQGVLTYGPYVASKYAVIGLTKTAALEMAPLNVRVNCICPGTIETPMIQQENASSQRAVNNVITPLGRFGKAEEVAALVHFLCSDEASFITGQSYVIDGGLTSGKSHGIWTSCSQQV
ncbi:SDR family NAD(P)-dependent oxidoreductase [Rossellomorea aquimaris]|uniref:SDR family NAD(P)-dependent oxidoreductase n=1 Tax=Rossellomorea aquimaris TaxID=189382 RepID=UPI003CEBEC34